MSESLNAKYPHLSTETPVKSYEIVDVEKDFDPSRVFYTATTCQTGKDGKKHFNTGSYYRSPKDGKLHQPLWLLPKCFGFGITAKFNYKNKEQHEGYQTTYSFTTNETVKTPTQAEKNALLWSETMYNVTLELLAFESERKDPVVAKQITLMWKARDEESKGWKAELVKEFMTKPAQQDSEKKPIKGTIDETKPYRMYIDLDTSMNAEKTFLKLNSIVEVINLSNVRKLITDPLKMYEHKDNNRFPDVSKVRGQTQLVLSDRFVWGMFFENPQCLRRKFAVYQYRIYEEELKQQRFSVLGGDFDDDDVKVDDDENPPQSSPTKPKFTMNLDGDGGDGGCGGDELPNQGENTPPQPQETGESQIQKIKARQEKARASKSKK